MDDTRAGGPVVTEHTPAPATPPGEPKKLKFPPTSAVIMGGLALSKVGYDRYLKFVWPFIAAAFVVVCLFVGGAAALS